MVRVRYTLGMVRLYGVEFPPNVWKEVGATILCKVRNADGWEVEGDTLKEVVEEVVEKAEELVEETVEETVEEEESVDLSLLTKKQLQKLCDEKGLEYKKLDNKTALLALLE